MDSHVRPAGGRMSHDRLRGAVRADTGLPQQVDETLLSLVDADADPRWPGAVWVSIDEPTPSLAGDNVTVRTTRRFVRCFEACCDDFLDGNCEEAHRRRSRFQPHQRPLLMRFYPSHRPLLTYEWPVEGAPPGREVGRRPRGVKWTTTGAVQRRRPGGRARHRSFSSSKAAVLTLSRPQDKYTHAWWLNKRNTRGNCPTASQVVVPQRNSCHVSIMQHRWSSGGLTTAASPRPRRRTPR